MCRWLVYKGDRILLSHLLFMPQNALMRQSHHEVFAPGLKKDVVRNSQLNADGYGVAWYDRRVQPVPAIFKTVSPAWHDRNLAEVSSIVQTSLLFAHIRAASPGSLVSRENCHPFKHGRFSFLHNGGVAGFRVIKRRLLASLPDHVALEIEGTTDSEHLFAMFLSELPQDVPMAEAQHEPRVLANAIHRVIERVLELQRAAGITAPSSLNLAVTDGRTVVASRFRNSEVEDPPSLYYSYGTWSTLL